MKNQICVLCRRRLGEEPTNLEHFVPSVLLRNAEKMGLRDEWTHALRIDRVGPISASKIHSLNQHKDWATIRVHERCNLDASQMCQDLKWWIDHPNQWPNDEQKGRICAYYANLWSYHPEQVTICRIEPQNPYQIVYGHGELSFGWLGIRSNVVKDFARLPHTIIIGTKEGLKQFQ